MPWNKNTMGGFLFAGQFTLRGGVGQAGGLKAVVFLKLFNGAHGFGVKQTIGVAAIIAFSVKALLYNFNGMGVVSYAVGYGRSRIKAARACAVYVQMGFVSAAVKMVCAQTANIANIVMAAQIIGTSAVGQYQRGQHTH